VQEIKLPGAWVRACIFFGKDRGEFIYRVRNKNGVAIEGDAGRRNVMPTYQLPYETAKKLAKRLKEGDITYTLWGAVEARIIKEQDGVITVVLPDNQVIDILEKRVLTRDRS
jgi:hypothetical protein